MSEGRRHTTDRNKKNAAALADEVPELGAIIGYKLRRAQLYVFQDFLDTFDQLKLRPAEFSVLVSMARSPGQTQSQIAEQLGIKRANFVALMDEMEKRGLAERRKSPDDKRSHSLHLTREGHRFVARMMEVWHDHERRLVARLGGEDERDRLLALLDRIITPDD